MPVKYIQLQPESETPDISAERPFRCVLVIEENTSESWKSSIATWLVKSGCLYLMAWGNECSIWHDLVDIKNIEFFGHEEIPDDKFIMTTWHDDESLNDLFHFSRKWAFHPTLEVMNNLIIYISDIPKEQELIRKHMED